MRNQLRMLIAEWLIGKALSIAPDTEEGNNLKYCIAVYFKEVIEKNITEIKRKMS